MIRYDWAKEGTSGGNLLVGGQESGTDYRRVWKAIENDQLV